MPKPLITSASQYETAALCLRKWWFQKVKRLPEIKGKQFLFGSVLHNVADRFFSADDFGNDPKTGEPVDLFPEGWRTSWEKYPGKDGKKKPEGTVGVEEGEQIRGMCLQAIESGVWMRRPGRASELLFHEKLGAWGDRNVFITGAVDVAYPYRIEDHKTTKSRRWAKGKDQLAQQQPMLTYAKFTCEKQEQIELRYNYFNKTDESDAPWAVETSVPWSAVGENYERIMALTGRMVETSTLTSWEEVEGPSCEGACRAFGGCPFERICSGIQTVEGYEAAHSTVIRKPSESLKGDNMPTIQEIMAKKKAERDAAMGKAPPAESPVDTKEAETSAPAGKIAPWAVADCAACGGTGYNSKGNPCRICKIKSAPSSAKKTEQEAETEQKTEASAETEQNTEQKTETPPKSEVEAKQEAKAKPKKEAKPEEKRGRGKQKPTVYVNCVPVGKSVEGDGAIFQAAVAMIQERGEGCREPLEWFFCSADTWKRREAFALIAEELAGSMPRHVVWSSRTGDHDALLAALNPHINLVKGTV